MTISSPKWLAAIAAKAFLAAVLGAPLFLEPVPQTLYMPRAVAQAYRNGTRSPDGRPGSKYWQNHGRYTIAVTALPPDRTIRGSEQIVYTNNSPDTLRNPAIKLFLNIHKPGAPRDGGAGADYLTSGVHVDAFAVNGQTQAWGDDANIFTTQRIKLPASLLPHDSVRLAFDWHYEISRQSGREGMIDSTTYFLAYFYPRVAVFDDYDGWDTMDFNDQQEFYSDFNDYDVSVHVPGNYIVWGTGTLRNAAEVLQPEYFRRFDASFVADTVVHIATKNEMATHAVTAQQPTNTWRFTANDIADMTFGLSDHYDWDAASVIVDDATHRRASAQAAFNDSAADYHQMVRYARHALDWFSHHWPGVPYPFEKTTIFQGVADMEYPMMVNDNSTPDTTFSRFVVEHEIAHSYFPFYMGINETRYGFMDEGWATTFEYLIGQVDMGKERATTFYQQFRVAGWINDPSPLEDLPIITPEDVLNGAAYGNNAYGKASLGYLAMMDLLGDPMFGKCLHEFMARWHGKHPIPWDFFNTFNDVAGRDLNWFWNNWYFSNNYIDLAVAGVAKTAAGYSVAVQNIGGMAAPFDVQLHFRDGTAQTLHETPAVWEANQKETKIPIATRKILQSLAVEGGIWMDADTTNNRWTAPPH